ncbi:MAG: Cell envelope-related transcriptional attenuator [Candidatus Peregrinibacteria bacterium GW2011_GWA2_47_7]|nr:MAG: Cell envelope-related transcriptional attenuator [Candidatus Peregrinibacteria bacterium GW2011_GWA2_47_7]
MFGKELAADEQGRTNILLFGVGGVGHEGEDLTDTIIVASISEKNNSVTMLSIPRDLYVESSLGAHRINELYRQGKLKWDSTQGLDFARESIGKILGIPIQYIAKVDFAAFEQIADAVGGIDVYVDEAINDPQYPRDGFYDYDPFYLPAGSQHLDGKTALKYVRSRKSSSDFSRSARQEKTLIALKNKIVQQSSFSRSSLIKELYYSLNEHVETNLSLREMLSLADLGSSINIAQIRTYTLNDDPGATGGFLYTPMRELYKGAFVLLPVSDNFDGIRRFVQVSLYGPTALAEFPIAVLNGTKENGFAGRAKVLLHQNGFAIAGSANARMQNLETTTWYAKTADDLPIVQSMAQFFHGAVVTGFPVEYISDQKLSDARVVLELGKDAAAVFDRLDVYKDFVIPIPASVSALAPAATKTALEKTTSAKTAPKK